MFRSVLAAPKLPVNSNFRGTRDAPSVRVMLNEQRSKSEEDYCWILQSKNLLDHHAQCLQTETAVIAASEDDNIMSTDNVFLIASAFVVTVLNVPTESSLLIVGNKHLNATRAVEEQILNHVTELKRSCYCLSCTYLVTTGAGVVDS